MGETDNEGGNTAVPTRPAMNLESVASEGGRSSSTRAASNATSREASHGPAAVAVLPNGRLTGRSSPARHASPSSSATGRAPAPAGSTKSGTVTRRGSLSSQASSKQAPAPIYGTRSRNRPGASRPNYAEDIDMDFEPQQPPQTVKHVREDSLSSIDDHSLALMETPEPALGNVPQKAATSNKVVATNGWNALNSKVTSKAAAAVASSNTTTTLVKKRKAASVATQNIASGSQTAPHPVLIGKKHGNNAAKHLSDRSERISNMVTFDKCKYLLNKDGNLISDDGVVFAPNDHVYLICEPPGEPYYLGRIMEFRCRTPENPKTPVEYLRINWAYRPRDVQRAANDTRMVYVTMHSDLCPLTSLRGKCQLKHRAEIDELDEYRKIPDAFWFNQCFDRFIHRWYEVIPTWQVVNVPQNVKKALDERWKYVVVEASRVKELTSAVKSCTRCSGYCAADDSVDCALCKKTYHLQCVKPPLLKKPSRGFAWACGPCSRDQERKREARRTPLVGEGGTDVEDEVVEEEEEAPKEDDSNPDVSAAGGDIESAAPEAEIAHAKMWPMRYLGIHCRVDDVLQYEDRAIYPRASSRLGPKHQATISEWYGQPVQLVKPTEIKRKYIKAGAKKEGKLTKETQQAIEADRVAKSKRPKYIEDEPTGYVARGEDFPEEDPRCTARLEFKLPVADGQSTRGIDDATTLPPANVADAYMERAREVATQIGVPPYCTDFLDRAVYLLQHNAFDIESALSQLRKTKASGKWPTTVWGWTARDSLREPRLALKDEQKRRFAAGVRRFGSELRLVRQYVGDISHADTVRYWYYWKKTPQGRKIWGAYDGRKNASKRKAASAEASTKLLDDVADDQDDSAFDSQKVYDLSRRMTCKFCNVKHSRFWRRAPNTSPGETVLGDARTKDKNTQFRVALCQRCARLWRKYAIRWEDQDEISKKISASGGRGWKRRVDEELVKEWAIAIETAHLPPIEPEDMPGVIVPSNGEPPRKKVKGSDTATPQPSVPEKKKAPVVPPPPPPPPPPPKEPTPPPIPNPAKFKVFPCAVCDAPETPNDPPGSKMLVCRDCKLTVHKGCYGVTEVRNEGKWSCDPCANDRREMANSSNDPAAYRYECVLCPVKISETSMVEPPKVSHKKKTDRDRERERLERLLVQELESKYRHDQLSRGRPVVPREALKRTADNKWVHVVCALWTPEVRFSDAKSLEVAEGIPLIPRARREQVCKLCKTSLGACVSCHHCSATFHVACAYKAYYIFGFDVMPVKSTRRDGVQIVKLGQETGTLTAGIWCKDHSRASIKGIIHYLNEVTDEQGKFALQLFAENYKQADLTLTGNARKANYLDEITKNTASTSAITPTSNRRVSTTGPLTTRSGRNSLVGPVKTDAEISNVASRRASLELEKVDRRCCVCDVGYSWKWVPAPSKAPAVQEPRINTHSDGPATNGKVNGTYEAYNATAINVGRPAILNGHEATDSSDSQDNNSTTASKNGHESQEVERWDCAKCAWLRKNNPEELEKKKEPEPPKPVAEPVRSPPRLPTMFDNTPELLPPARPTWTFSTNGAHATPRMNAMVPHGHAGYHHPAQPPFNPPLHQPVYPAPISTVHVPHPPPQPLRIINSVITNGLPSPHGVPSLRSPGHPPPLAGNSYPRQSEGPYNTAPPPPTAGYPRAYSQHGSPVPGPAGAVQIAGMGLTRPTTPRETMATTPRLAHNASASPNVRNILND